MITIALVILLIGLIINRQNFLIIIMIIELLYLILGLLLIIWDNSNLVIYILGMTTSETAIGLSIILGYYSLN